MGLFQPGEGSSMGVFADFLQPLAELSCEFFGQPVFQPFGVVVDLLGAYALLD